MSGELDRFQAERAQVRQLRRGAGAAAPGGRRRPCARLCARRSPPKHPPTHAHALRPLCARRPPQEMSYVLRDFALAEARLSDDTARVWASLLQPDGGASGGSAAAS